MSEGIESAVGGFLAHKRALGRKYDRTPFQASIDAGESASHPAGLRCLAKTEPGLVFGEALIDHRHAYPHSAAGKVEPAVTRAGAYGSGGQGGH